MITLNSSDSHAIDKILVSNGWFFIAFPDGWDDRVRKKFLRWRILLRKFGVRVKSIEATDGHNHFLCVFFAVTLFMSPIALADLGAANSGDNSSLRLG